MSTVSPLARTQDTQGPKVWLDYDQAGLDDAYDQTVWAPLMADLQARRAAISEETRRRLGPPERLAYGSTAVEALDVFRAPEADAPIFVFIHGGGWKLGEAKSYAFAAEMLRDAGVTYVVPDFAPVTEFGGDLMPMAAQVRRAIAWTYQNAAAIGGDASRFYLAGHSSGAHLAAVALTADWETEFGIPSSFIKGGLLMSGMYDMKPVRLSKRSDYVTFTDTSENALSPQRHLDRLVAPLVVSVGTKESPEFIRQAHDFVAAVTAVGKAAELIVAPEFNHIEVVESLGNPYGPNGRAALKLMGLR